MTLKIIHERLRQEHNLPAEFQFCRWEQFPKLGPVTFYTEIEGCIPPKFKSGPRKGRPNWKAATGRRVFQVGTQTWADWVAQWVARTGNCAECHGTGKQVARVSAKDGTEYKTCRECGGSGKAKVVNVSP